MSITRKQLGFSLVEGLIVIAVIALVAAVGYVAWNQFNNSNDQVTTTSEQKAVAEDVPAAPEINETSDLDEANAALDSVEVGGSDDSATLEREAESF